MQFSSTGARIYVRTIEDYGTKVKFKVELVEFNVPIDT